MSPYEHRTTRCPHHLGPALRLRRRQFLLAGVALIMLAAFLYNSIGFHGTMAQSSLLAPIVVAALWLFIAWPHRDVFVPIFKAKL